MPKVPQDGQRDPEGRPMGAQGHPKGDQGHTKDMQGKPKGQDIYVQTPDQPPQQTLCDFQYVSIYFHVYIYIYIYIKIFASTCLYIPIYPYLKVHSAKPAHHAWSHSGTEPESSVHRPRVLPTVSTPSSKEKYGSILEGVPTTPGPPSAPQGAMGAFFKHFM